MPVAHRPSPAARRRAVMRAVPAVLLATLVVVAAAGGVLAQQDGARTVKRIVEEARRSNPSLQVTLDPVSGLPTRVRGLKPAVDPDIAISASRSATGAPSEADILKTAEAFFRTGELSAAFAAGNPRTEVAASRVRNDPDVPGQSIVHVEQRVDGIPVFGSAGRVLVGPSLAVTQLTTTFSGVDVQSTTPTTEKDKALAAARDHVRFLISRRARDIMLDKLRASIDTVASDASLVIYDPALLRSRGSKAGPARLSWLVTIDAFRVFIDAQSSEVLFSYLDRHWAVPRRVNDLQGQTTFPGVRVIDDASGERREPLHADALSAHTNAGDALDYFVKLFGRSGVLETGPTEALALYVRFASAGQAYWCKDQTFDCPERGAIVLGSATPAAIDIVGHELTHGVITAEADLIYANEPGAVNESLADLFGTLIEFRASPGTANWVLGERLPGSGPTAPVRSMADPNMMSQDGVSLFDRNRPYSQTNRGQPDHYSEYVNREDPICETTSDYFSGCVHFNSGILNKMYFLVAEGGRHRGTLVKGIGRDKLGRIAYRSLVAYLNASSGLIEAADAMQAACAELADLQTAGVVAGDCDRIRDAQAAVGLLVVTN